MYNKSLIPIDDLKHQYLDLFMSLKELAKYYNCSTEKIRSHLTKSGVSIRDGHESQEIVGKKLKKLYDDEPERRLQIGECSKKMHREHPELAQKLSERSTEMWKDPIYKEMMLGVLDDYWSIPENLERRTGRLVFLFNTDEYKDLFSEKGKVAHANNPEWAEKSREYNKLRWQDTQYRQDMCQMSLDIWKNPVYREETSLKISLSIKELWDNMTPEQRAERITNVLKASAKRPTSLEQIVIEVCEKYNLPYDYNGDGKEIVCGKAPDFLYRDRKIPLILETNGERWHPFTDQSERIDYFAPFGYRVLVLWGNELNNATPKQICDRINDFTQKYFAELPYQIKFGV